MITDIYQWMINSGDSERLLNFKVGYMTGVIFFLILLLVIMIIYYYLFSSRKKVHEIRIPGEGGSLFISSGAISDMVKFVGAKFDYIDITKVMLWESKCGIVMDINVSYDMHGERFPELANELKAAIRNNLDGQLGIDSVKFIDIHDKKITDTKNSRF